MLLGMFYTLQNNLSCVVLSVTAQKLEHVKAVEFEHNVLPKNVVNHGIDVISVSNLEVSHAVTNSCN